MKEEDNDSPEEQKTISQKVEALFRAQAQTSTGSGYTPDPMARASDTVYARPDSEESYYEPSDLEDDYESEI